MIRHNWLAIIILVVLHMAIGFLWYGVFFSEQWSQAAFGKSVQEMYDSYNGEMPMAPYIVNVIAAFCATLFLSWLVNKLNYNTFGEGLKLGLYASAGLIFPAIAVHYMFLYRTHTLLAIDLSMSVLITILTAGILAAWRKKPAVN